MNGEATPHEKYSRKHQSGYRKKTGQYRLQTAKDVIRAVEKAREAQPAWEALSLKRRSSHILKVRDYIVANSDRIAETISTDNGKAVTDSHGHRGGAGSHGGQLLLQTRRKLHARL
jgi:acyl-CoA reductase-like NAD-dependent aldehyde dehydrogenase